MDWDTKLPEEESLINRDDKGRPVAPLHAEAFIRFPIMGSRAGMRTWAAYYAVQMRTVIDVVGVDGTLIERFNGQGATKRPADAKAPGVRKPRTNGGGGAVATVQKLMVADQSLSIDAVTKTLQEMGITGTNASTIAMTRQMTLAVFACIENIRQLVVNDPAITVEALTAELTKVGLGDTSPSTIVATRAATLSVLKMIA